MSPHHMSRHLSGLRQSWSASEETRLQCRQTMKIQDTTKKIHTLNELFREDNVVSDSACFMPSTFNIYDIFFRVLEIEDLKEQIGD
ncbi:hypothetical protein FSP39_000089 [Pinctada imbricata]|uniref:Uncharacterized protein n=1 Tax=Pinctada imbricata TaxID=66713 RepID=A0AA89C8S6_PINIB|nr:hypothetical protein FSP39_000089 [Pinctada imbricata]